MGLVSGGLDTGSSGMSNVIEYDVAGDVLRLVPDATPVITYVKSKVSRVKPTTTPEFYWYEEDNFTFRYMTSSSEFPAASTASTITVDDASPLYTNALLKVPSSGEVIRVMSLDANGRTFQAQRQATYDAGAGTGTAAATILSTDVLVLMGNVNAEFAGLLSVVQSIPTRHTGYTQIVREPLQLSGTLQATRLYTGDPEKDEIIKAAIQHKLDLEKIALFGEAKADTSTFARTARYSMGVISKIATNITNVGGALTEDAFEEFLRTGFRWNAMAGRKHKLFVCSTLVAKYINSFARDKIRIVKDTTSYGVRIGRYTCAHGTIDIAIHDLLEEGYSGYGMLLDVSMITYRPLVANGNNRDTKLREDVLRDGTDGVTHEYLTEMGLEVRGDKFHSIMKGVT